MHVVSNWACPTGRKNSEIFREIRYVWISHGGKCAHVAFLPGGNSYVSHLPRGEIRMCWLSPREKSTSDMFGFILGRTADMDRFLPGRNLIYPGEKSHVVWCCPAGHDNSEILGFLPGRNPICVDFSWGEMRTCCTSPGEKVAGVAFQLGKNRICLIYPRAKSTSDICGFLPGENPTYADYSREEFWTCCISPREKSAPVGFLPGRHFNLSHFPRGEIHFFV